jgi:4-hydroxy-2-oxoglutarate aldolase
MRELEGVFIPAPTPYRGDAVAPGRLKGNLERWNRTEVAGYVILDSTGECPLLSEFERDTTLEAARAAIPPDKTFIAGTGCDATPLTIHQTRRAAALGADAALVITPHFFTREFSRAGAQVRHFLAVAEASPIPIIVHNAPGDTGIGLAPDSVARIAEHANVCGIEDSSGDISWIALVIHLTPKAFHVLVGDAPALVPALSIGGAGGVLALAAVAPRELVEIYSLARRGRWDEAREIAARMMRAEVGVAGRHGIGGLKAALDLQGLYGGPCRPPLLTPDGDGIEDIKESLACAGLL